MALHGEPYVTVKTKRSFDAVPVRFDFHDFLVNQREAGVAVAVDFVIRPLRAAVTGFQYRCTRAGVCSPEATSELTWPQSAGVIVSDGTVQWTSEALTAESFRSTISSQQFVVPGAVTSNPLSVEDMIYSTIIAGGVSGTSYNISCQVVLGDGEEKEAIAVLPVAD